jgi:hypothetical protein
MKSLTLAALATCLTFGSQAIAQDQPKVKVDAKAPKLNTIQTPQFSAGNVPEKNWRPRNWLELDMELAIKLASAEGGRNGSLPSLVINYYLATQGQSTDGKKRMVLKGNLTYSDVPAGEKCHAMAFVSPDTMRRIMKKDNFTASDVAGWGYEIVVDGTVVAKDSSAGGSWWEKTDGFEMVENALLVKQETPFAILWGDYDLKAKGK